MQNYQRGECDPFAHADALLRAYVSCEGVAFRKSVHDNSDEPPVVGECRTEHKFAVLSTLLLRELEHELEARIVAANDFTEDAAAKNQATQSRACRERLEEEQKARRSPALCTVVKEQNVVRAKLQERLCQLRQLPRRVDPQRPMLHRRLYEQATRILFSEVTQVPYPDAGDKSLAWARLFSAVEHSIMQVRYLHKIFLPGQPCPVLAPFQDPTIIGAVRAIHSRVSGCKDSVHEFLWHASCTSCEFAPRKLDKGDASWLSTFWPTTTKVPDTVTSSATPSPDGASGTRAEILHPTVPEGQLLVTQQDTVSVRLRACR